jgi:hypothetical protein
MRAAILGAARTRRLRPSEAQKGSPARWQHSDGRATTIPVHPGTEIGGWLYREMLKQRGITEEEFRKLR